MNGRILEKRRFYLLIVILLCFLAYVAPIPAHNAAEVNSALSQQLQIGVQRIEKGTTIPIVFSQQFEEEIGYSIVNVNGTATLEEDNCYSVELSVHTDVFNADDCLNSTETVHCSVIIPEYEKMMNSFEVLLNDAIEKTSKNNEGKFIPSYQDWGDFDTYYWRNKLFVSLPGSAETYVKYDHPDNYYTYHREQWNLHWQMYDSYSRTYMIHLAVYELSDAITLNSLGGILSAAAGIIGVLIATLAGVILGILAGLFLTIAAFIYLVVMAERNDGWEYLCGPGVWPYTNWWWISFGIWRDIWWILQF